MKIDSIHDVVLVVKKIEQTMTGLTGVQEKTNTNVDTFSTGVTTLTSEVSTCVQQQTRQVGVMGDFLVRLEDMSWLGRHPAKIEITRSSGGDITPNFFFFTKIMIFLDY